jgi:hypothetical protein
MDTDDPIPEIDKWYSTDGDDDEGRDVSPINDTPTEKCCSVTMNA